MPYSDPIAKRLYERSRWRNPEEKERKRLAMARLRAERRARGEREPEYTPQPIKRLQRAISAWRN